MVDVGHTLVVVGSKISLPDPDKAGYFCTNKGVYKHAQTAQNVGVKVNLSIYPKLRYLDSELGFFLNSD